MKEKRYRPFWIGLIGCIVIVATLFLYGQLNYRLHSAPGATLSVGPNPASPGTTVMVTGFHYVAAKKVEVYFQNRANGVVNAVTNGGGFFNVALQLPRQYIDGQSYVYAVSDSMTTRAPLHFASPSLTYAPVKTSQNTSTDLESPVLVRGTGFMANEPVSFELRNEATALKTGKLTTDSNGAFTLPLSMENTPYKHKSIFTVRDPLHKPLWTVPIWPMPALRLLPTQGKVDTQVYIHGQGFGRDETVKISFQGTVVGWAHTSYWGNFRTLFRVPNTATLTPSTNNVLVIGTKSGAIATASFQLQSSVSLSSRVVSPNQQVFTSGSQFSPNGRVDIVFVDPDISSSSVGTLLATITTSPSGQFSTSFHVPGTAIHQKVYNIVHVDDTTGLNAIVPIFVQ